MIELIRKMVAYIPLEEIRDNDILLLKGVYKIPKTMKDVKTQLKYKKQWQ